MEVKFKFLVGDALRSIDLDMRWRLLPDIGETRILFGVAQYFDRIRFEESLLTLGPIYTSLILFPT